MTTFKARLVFFVLDPFFESDFCKDFVFLVSYGLLFLFFSFYFLLSSLEFLLGLKIDHWLPKPIFECYLTISLFWHFHIFDLPRFRSFGSSSRLALETLLSFPLFHSSSPLYNNLFKSNLFILNAHLLHFLDIFNQFTLKILLSFLSQIPFFISDQLLDPRLKSKGISFLFRPRRLRIFGTSLWMLIVRFEKDLFILNFKFLFSDSFSDYFINCI